MAENIPKTFKPRPPIHICRLRHQACRIVTCEWISSCIYSTVNPIRITQRIGFAECPSTRVVAARRRHEHTKVCGRQESLEGWTHGGPTTCGLPYFAKRIPQSRGYIPSAIG